MVLDTRLVVFPFTSETVWSAGLSATATAGGRSLSVGFEGDWAPEHLFLMSVEACFMSTFLSLAYSAGLEVLGYVSSARLEQAGHTGTMPAVSLAPVIVVGSPTNATLARDTVAASVRESVLARLLGPRLRMTPDIRLVSERSE